MYPQTGSEFGCTLSDERHALTVYVVNSLDIDGLVPIVTTCQIEWNEIGVLLRRTMCWDRFWG